MAYVAENGSKNLTEHDRQVWLEADETFKRNQEYLISFITRIAPKLTKEEEVKVMQAILDLATAAYRIGTRGYISDSAEKLVKYKQAGRAAQAARDKGFKTEAVVRKHNPKLKRADQALLDRINADPEREGQKPMRLTYLRNVVRRMKGTQS